MACRSWTWTLSSHGGEAELVGRAVDVSAARAAAGQPHREAVMVVVAAAEGGELGDGRAAELAAPDHQRTWSNSPRCFRSVRNAAIGWSQSRGELAMLCRQVVVIVPRLAGAAPDLDEPHAALEQPAGDQQLPALRCRARTWSRIGSGSRLMSKASAASDCIR